MGHALDVLPVLATGIPWPTPAVVVLLVIVALAAIQAARLGTDGPRNQRPDPLVIRPRGSAAQDDGQREALESEVRRLRARVDALEDRQGRR